MILLYLISHIVATPVYICPGHTNKKHIGISDTYIFLNSCSKNETDYTPTPIENTFNDKIYFKKTHTYY